MKPSENGTVRDARASDSAGATPGRQVERSAAPAPKRCALIVDDSRMIRSLSRRIVASVGFEVNEAENGQEALARCKAAMPDLVLLDWDMPVMTGIEFVAALRAMPGGARPKVVFCTSKSGAHDIHKGIDAGADEWIAKPFDEAGLRAKLQAVLAS